MDRFFVYELLMLVFLNAAALLFVLHLRRSRGRHVVTARLLSLALSMAFICGTAANCANGVHIVLLLLSILGMVFSCAAVCLAFIDRQEDAAHE